MSQSQDMPYRERDINGTSYKAYTLTLDRWAELTEYLGSIIGEPLASVLRGDTPMAPGADLSFGRGDFEALLGGFVAKLTAKSIMALAGHMSRSLRANESMLKVDKQKLWWPQHMKDLAPAVSLFLEAQYADFYEGLSDSLPETKKSDEDLDSKESDSSEPLNP